MCMHAEGAGDGLAEMVESLLLSVKDFAVLAWRQQHNLCPSRHWLTEAFHTLHSSVRATLSGDLPPDKEGRGTDLFTRPKRQQPDTLLNLEETHSLTRKTRLYSPDARQNGASRRVFIYHC